MKFYSTRNKTRLYSLQEAAFLGLASDGGLFMPESIPQVDLKKVFFLARRSFPEMAAYLAELFFSEDLSQEEIHAAVNNALSFPIPLKEVGKSRNGKPLHTLELFHGPTFAFKDVGASCMGQILSALLKKRGGKEKLIILTATSGDTGSAVARGFYNIPEIDVVILFPNGKVSPLQECQMTTLGKNIYPVKINGTFDDCQKLVKEAFNNKELRQHRNITSANSINLLRWLPQSFYYFYGYCQWVDAVYPYFDWQSVSWLNKEQEEARQAGGLHNEPGNRASFPQPVIVVPSGNYGNISAGMLAKKMGLPIAGFVAASNSNDIIPKYLKTGMYTPCPSVQTIANAMDVGNPSNYERILDLYNNNYNAICADVAGFSCNDTQIREGIRELYSRYNYLSCPHSAVGYNATQWLCQQQTKEKSTPTANKPLSGIFKSIDPDAVFWLSTAHPAKFQEVLKETLGQQPPIPASLASLLQKPRTSISMEPEFGALEAYLNTRFSSL